MTKLNRVLSPATLMDVEALKAEAGRAACKYVEHGMNVGLGTGSTVKYTIIELGRRVAEEGLEIIGVPTSIATEALAKEVGIPLASLDDLNGLDIVIDGTDEFDPQFQLIKGGGAALLREKIVAQSSARMVVVADQRKQVDTLGAFPLPIEITPFSHLTTVRALEELLNCSVTLRTNEEGTLVTDNGNFIVDAHTGPTIRNPLEMERTVLNIAGVVQVGLFNNMCDVVVLASGDGVVVLEKA
ncbi:MAG: ribose-5-phosphate isomerase RpiA [Candidatus Poseidonia sp.]|nr:ribose-5-phosphate isomerase RpiA [Poseidonia sp.]